jgi:hypothetical protein
LETCHARTADPDLPGCFRCPKASGRIIFIFSKRRIAAQSFVAIVVEYALLSKSFQ